MILRKCIDIDEDILENDKGQQDNMGNGKVIIQNLENDKKE